jgi:Tol biopolymer transport system component
MLSPGSRIGLFEVTGSLGAGGMGEVYRARDTRLGREVALKILPAEFVADAERLARFDREARTLAALNHPHIAHLHGVEDSGAVRALVMELVEGEDLAVRLKRGRLPLNEALAIARQIADALAAAHEQGIVHRDLKPANVKIRDDGTVKVLDFGLAKAFESTGTTGRSGSQADAVLNSPTITTPAMTMHGMILGTAAYMAPEQAKGKPVDKRADIWAFGCVLYEMVSGRRAFQGDDVSDTLASVLRAEVEWSVVPASIERLLKKCLERDPRRRLHDIADAWDLIDTAPARTATSKGGYPRLAWAAAAIFAVLAAALAAVHFGEQAPTRDAARFQLQAPAGQTFDIYVAVAPNGRRLAFTARDQKGIARLWVRDLDSLEARVLPGTEGAWSPFWSPDSRLIAFADERLLKKIDPAGGLPQTVCQSPALVGLGTWNHEGVILYGTRGAGPLWRVSAGGGDPVAVTAFDAVRQEFHSFPAFLADGRRFIYFRQSANPAVQGIYAGSLDVAPADQPNTRIAHTLLGPVLAVRTPAGDRLLYMRESTLVAQPFDLTRLVVSGEAQRLAEGVGSSGSFAYFGAAGADLLVYRAGAATSTNLEQLTWMDRNGQTTGTFGDARPYSTGAGMLVISPDGSRAMVGIAPLPTPDLWSVEFSRAVFTRFTFHAAPDLNPIWSPDGARVAFRSNRDSNGDLFVKDASGATDEQPLLRTAMPETPTDWSRDGRFLLYARSGVQNGQDIAALRLDATGGEVTLLETPFNEGAGKFSPDGRWMAYVSNESGQPEVYLRPFVIVDGTPSLGAKWQVSNTGGTAPRWRGDGKELFYRNPDGAIMVADVSVDGTLVRTTLPRQLFALPLTVNNWDVMPDGQRFLVLRSVAAPIPDPVSVVLNWQPPLGR